MKTQFRTLLPALTALLLPLSTFADTEVVDGITWTYTISDGKASVGGGSSTSRAVDKTTSGSITIPSSLGGCPVTSILRYAFYGCSGLTSITIPDGVTSVGHYAFSGCSGLTSIVISDSVTSIGSYAFKGCSGLESVTIPNGVTTIMPNAFCVCSNLRSIAIPDSVTSIGTSAFFGCSGLTSITIPNSVTVIDRSAFGSCSGLTNAVVGNSVMSIGTSAFEGCFGLRSITIGDSVTSIGPSAFSDCSGLTSITIPESVTSIGNHALSNCSGLTTVKIPCSVTSVGNDVFSGCTGLTSLFVPEEVEIGSLGVDVSIIVRYVDNPIVTLDGNGGSPATFQIVCSFGNPYGELPSPTRIGFTFSNWAYQGIGVDAETITIPTNHTLVAIWNPNEYIVSFDATEGEWDDEIPTIVVSFGAPYGCLPEPFLLGHHCVWQCSGSPIYNDTIVTTADNHTLTAVWMANEYIVTFDATGGTTTPSNQIVAFNSAYGELPIPTRAGYSFGCWNLHDIAVTTGTICTTPSNHVLVSTWSPNEYTVSFDAADGTMDTSSKTVTFDAAYGELPEPSRTGHSFAGWTLDGDAVNSGTIVATPDDHTLVATWTPNEYKVFFDAAGGEWEGDVPTNVVTYGSAYGELPVPIRTGYSYVWSLDGFTVGSETTVRKLSDHTLVAVWTPNEYGVTFNVMGGAVSPESIIVTFDAVYGELPIPMRNGYSFVGWTLGESNVNAESIVSLPSDHTLVATWTANDYLVSFDAAGGGWEGDAPTKMVKFDATYGELPVPMSNDHVFLDWILDGGVVNSENVVRTAQDHTLMASWSDWLILFDANGGEGTMAKQPVWFNDSTTISTNCFSREGFFFLGWALSPGGAAVLLDGDSTSEIEAEAGETVTLYAVWHEGKPFLDGWVCSVGGDSEYSDWYVQTTTTHDGNATVLSDIYGGSTAFLEAKVTGSGTLSFWWKVSSYQNHNYLTFEIDGSQVAQISGTEGAWTKRSFTVTDEGTHTFRWTYSHTMSAGLAEGYDCGWVGEVSWPNEKIERAWKLGSYPPTLEGSFGYAIRFNANGGEFVPNGNGLNISYYDISSSGYSTWTQSEAAMTNYFAARTPTIVTNTLDWGAELTSGFVESGLEEYYDNLRASAGLAPLKSDACLFHGKYSSGGQNYFATFQTGYLKIDDGGMYSFGALADDYIVVYVDGQKVCNSQWQNYGIGSINLSSGIHRVAIAHHENSGGQGLSVQWKKPGDASYSPIPQSVLFRETEVSGTTVLPKRIYASGDVVDLPDDRVRRTGYSLAGWAMAPDGPVAYPATGTLASGVAASNGETVDLYAVWTANEYTATFDADGGEFAPVPADGLDLRYYDIPDEDYWTWSDSETALTNYFAFQTATIETNTLDFGESLDPGIAGVASSSVSSLLSWGMNGLRFEANGTTNRFHGKYAQKDQENIAVYVFGEIGIEEPGAYSFACIADDHEAIFIDGQRVCCSQWDSVGSGSISLSAGFHRFSMGFSEGGGGHGFAVQWKKPGGTAWSPLPQSVLWSSQRSRIPDSKAATFDAAYGELPTVSRTGYTFAEWTIDGVGITAETICTQPSNHVIVAAWTPNGYEVSFDPTGGTVSPTAKVVTFDAAYGELPTPACEGYVFLDWRLDGAAVDAATIVQTAEDHTLAARWGVAVGNGVWEEMIGDEPIVLGAPEVAPTGAVEIPAEIAGRPVVAISADAFAGNAAITSISIPASVTNIADGAFAGCTGLKSVSVSSLYGCARFAELFPELADTVERVGFLDGVTAIPDNFFEGCTALRTMDLAASVVDIGTNVFEACSALETVVSNGLEICDGWVLGMASGETAPADLAIPDGVRGIAAFAFDGEGGIGTLALPESLRFIGAGAFRNCTGLEGIAVPEGVWKIDREAFRNCTYAQGLALGAGIVELGDGAFANGSMLMGAEVPAGVETIGENCFSNCWRMLSVSIPQSVERVGAGAFADCRRLAGATVPLHVAPMSELFPAAYASLETISISRLDLEALEHLEGLESENAIQAYIASRQMVPDVFAGCAALEGIELPPWVCNVADGAFEGCAAMDEIAFPDAVTNIGARACASMAALEAVAFPAGLVAIGEGALSNCAAVASLALPDGLRTIGARAFDGLALLARADVPGSVRAIGDGAFAGCAAIRAVAMPGDAGTVADIFPDCYADIVSATVVAETDGAGAPLPVVMDGLFEGCAALTRVELPQDLAEIGAGAFADCAALTEIGIPAAVTNIGAAAFAGCGTLSSIALPKSLEVVQDRTFQGCASMAEIIVPESVRALGTAVFDGCTLLRSVRFVGNAPDYATADGGPYAGVPAGAKSYVANGSMGWDGIPTSRALPEYWPAGTTYEIDFWTPNRCAVSFDANYEGAGEPAAVEQVTGTSYVLPADPVRPGARFGGWWTAPENGARITASTQVTATRPHTFYAHWTMNRYYVHFDASGGSGTADPVEMTVGTPAALPACPFAKVAHDFAGWATEPGGEAVYADGAEVVDLAYAQNAAVTLYAVWRSRDWTLADYLDAPTLDFETSGGGEWGPDWQDAKAGGVSLRCDGLPPAAEGRTVEAALRTMVTGAGTLAFWWKVSCEENDEQYDDWFDYAAFSVDGAEVSRIAGDSGWVRVESAVTGAGEHGLVWTFTRDDYDEDGADWENALWVDGVEWTPAPVTLSFDAGGATEGAPPAAVVKYEGYALALPGPGTLADPPRVFAGWSDGESVYAAGATYVFGSADAVLTAVWTLQTWTLAEAVDAPALVFATGGDADWAVDTTAGWTNGVSAKSGSVTNSQASWIETMVSGAGTLSFRWKVLGGIYRNNPFAYAKVETNGAVAAQTHLTDGWEEQTVEVSGAGTHTIRWTYLRTSARTADGDCAWLDGVAWTPAGAASVVVEGVEIPIAWLDEAAASIVAASGGDYAAAAEAPAANGVNEVWECYVAGLDPTNAASRLLATIDMVDGEPAIRWTPDLNEGGTRHERDYVVEGKTNLVDRSWGPTNEATRFFRVKVEMP